MACFLSPSRNKIETHEKNKKRVPSPGTYKINYNLTQKASRNTIMRKKKEKLPIFDKRDFTDLNQNYYRYFKNKDKVLKFDQMPK